jgi:type IV secretory pathway VirB6-like protein
MLVVWGFLLRIARYIGNSDISEVSSTLGTINFIHEVLTFHVFRIHTHKSVLLFKIIKSGFSLFCYVIKLGIVFICTGVHTAYLVPCWRITLTFPVDYLKINILRVMFHNISKCVRNDNSYLKPNFSVIKSDRVIFGLVLSNLVKD